MMHSKPSFIPLYFDEDESDLWQAIQQIEPKKRSAFIKEALRLVLQSHRVGEKFLTHLSSKTFNMVQEKQEKQEKQDLMGIDEENNEQNSSKSQSVEMAEDHGDMETFSLDALFTEGHAPDLTKNNLQASQGYQHMMKNIIGIENDEAVMKVFRGHSELENK